MTVISSTSGRTITIDEGVCGGLSVSVRDGRENGRTILLNREGAQLLSDALLAWLNQPALTTLMENSNEPD
jgi:hypothetical protein